MDNNTSDFKENSSINTIIENQDNLPINEISNQDINTKMTMQENKDEIKLNNSDKEFNNLLIRNENVDASSNNENVTILEQINENNDNDNIESPSEPSSSELNSNLSDESKENTNSTENENNEENGNSLPEENNPNICSSENSDFSYTLYGPLLIVSNCRGNISQINNIVKEKKCTSCYSLW